MPVLRTVLTLLFAAGSCAWLTRETRAAQPAVRVEVASGRAFHGLLDNSSTAEQLVLQTVQSGITLRRSIAWQRILKATVEDRSVSLAELRAIAAEVSGSGAQGSRSWKIELRGNRDERKPSASIEQAASTSAPPQAKMVSFDAYIANWDFDVETDGLVVEIVPLDADGSLVPASGTLEVELFAPQRRVFHHAPLSGGDTLELVERWTRAVQATDFGPRGALFRLPYGAIHPELRPDWMASWYGLVHVRLTIPGHGVFEDSRDGVRIRPWAPNRDQLELNTGRRFVPTERLGRPD